MSSGPHAVPIPPAAASDVQRGRTVNQASPSEVPQAGAAPCPGCPIRTDVETHWVATASPGPRRSEATCDSHSAG
eukprot:5488378-Prorocentrum_lima.AAC.1